METTVETKKYIMRLTGLSEYQYNLILFEMAMTFLDHECNYDPESIRIMSSCELFWKWWNNLYQQRDQAWINEGYRDQRTYRKWQNTEKINQYPNRFIYERAYDEFFGTLHKRKEGTANNQAAGGTDCI